MARRSPPVTGQTLGKLCFDPRDVGSIKCLIAVGMTKRRIELEVKVSSSKESPLLFTTAGGNVQLRDPFSIAWFLANYDYRNANKGFPDRYGAQIIQWNSFSDSEVKPFLLGLLGPDSPRRDVAKANKLRKQRFSTSLDVLNETLMQRKFLAGQKFTLADICVAADLAPVLDPDWKRCFNSFLVKDVMKKHYVYLYEWYAGVASRPMFKKALAEISLPSKKTTPDEGGDVNNVENGKVKHGNRKKPRPRGGSGGQTKKNDEKPEPDMGEVGWPLRVLCLHGYRQNENLFREKIGAFRKLVGKYVDFTFITAPHHVLPMSNEDINQDQRGWWFSRENDYFKADDVSDLDKGFESSLDLVNKTFNLHGPFDGIMGFSQGAALAALICLMKERQPELLSPSVKFNFAIFVAAFRSKSNKHSAWYEVPEDFKIAIPTLHVMGSEDRVIRNVLSEEILEFFADPTVLHHSGGHYLPATRKQKGSYLSFFKKVNGLCDQGSAESAVEDENRNAPCNVKDHVGHAGALGEPAAVPVPVSV